MKRFFCSFLAPKTSRFNYLDVQTLILLKLFEIGINKFIKNILIVTLFNSGL